MILDEVLGQNGKKGIVIFGVGVFGEDFCKRMKAMHYGELLCFCDNNPQKQGEVKFGLDILSPTDAVTRYKEAYFVITLWNHTRAAKIQLLQLCIREDKIVIFNQDDYINAKDMHLQRRKDTAYEAWCKKYTGKIAGLKDRFRGKRCFIIGNGGSLTIEDLESLQGEYTFGANRIYMLYGRTWWRPTFYCVYDLLRIRMIRENLEEIIDASDYVFTTAEFKDELPEKYYEHPKFYYLNNVKKKFFPDPPEFSNDASKIIYDGQTVTFMATQIAVYMGFREIYFLGMDNHYSAELKQDGSVAYDQNFKDYPDGMGDIDLKETVIPQIELTTLSFHSTKKFVDEHGIRVVNVTRGGMLDVFERMSLEDVLEGNGGICDAV